MYAMLGRDCEKQDTTLEVAGGKCKTLLPPTKMQTRIADQDSGQRPTGNLRGSEQCMLLHTFQRAKGANKFAPNNRGEQRPGYAARHKRTCL